MSVLDKVIAAVTPPESDEARMQARQQAETLTRGDDWLGMVLEHHRQIEAAFARVASAETASKQRAAEKELGTLLTGHSLAEEVVLYPALVKADEESHSTKAYTEQSAAKVQMGLLEDLEPLTQDYKDKLGHIRGAVAHHMYEEEGTWFPELKAKLNGNVEQKLTSRYAEEFTRYMGNSDRKNAPDQPVPRPVFINSGDPSPVGSAPPSKEDFRT